MKITNEVKVAIIENNLNRLGQMFFDAELNLMAAKELGKVDEAKTLETQMSEILKKQSIFEKELKTYEVQDTKPVRSGK